MQSLVSRSEASVLVERMKEEALVEPVVRKEVEYNPIEKVLLESILENINSLQMSEVRTFFFVPVGLPGMGKTTLSKNFRSACQKFFFSQIEQN